MKLMNYYVPGTVTFHTKGGKDMQYLAYDIRMTATPSQSADVRVFTFLDPPEVQFTLKCPRRCLPIEIRPRVDRYIAWRAWRLVQEAARWLYNYAYRGQTP